MLDELKRLVTGKYVFLAAHWDADGVTSGSLVFHHIKDVCKSIKVISKGDVFMIGPDDVDPKADIIITVDIKPSPDLKQPVFYIDHHPWQVENGISQREKYNFGFELFDESYQSCSLLIYHKLVRDKANPYYIFLALLGYFGDGGDNTQIPAYLEAPALEKFPELMKHNPSRDGGTYLEIERYVSLINTGKRLHWSGQVPMTLFTTIDSYMPFISNTHPLARELQNYRKMLQQFYNMPLDLTDLGHIQYAMINCTANVQGVLCARYMHKKPIVVLNEYNNSIIASMRVPDELDFDAGAYLASFKSKIQGMVGGGHGKAGGATFPKDQLPVFLELLKQQPQFADTKGVIGEWE